MTGGDIFVVTVTLDPKPLASLGLDEKFTRIDFTSRCNMLHVLESMARVLRVSKEDLSLESEADEAVDLAFTLGEYHDQHAGPQSFIAVGAGNRPRREINLKVKHTPLPQQLVTCTVGGGEGRKCLRRATVRLPNTATFRELLESARKQRYAALDFEGPVYGRDGELETTLRDAWVRNDCKVDGTLHIGLAVAVSFILESRATLSFIMGPADTIGGVKQRISADQGHAPSTQRLTIRGGAQRLEDDITLEKCCVSGIPVGGVSSAGWGELHLELHLKDCVENSFRVKLGGAIGSRGTDKWVHAVGASPDFRCSDVKYPHSVSLPKAKIASGSRCSNPQGDQKRRAGPTTTESPCSSGSASVDDLPSPGNRGDAYATVMFALSPSGRALTLTMPPAATVLDAKEQVAGCEGIYPCRQRLLWRGIPMEPDSAVLYKVGARGGDTLIVGYRVSSVTTGIMAPVAESEVPGGEDAVSGEDQARLKHPRVGGAEHDSNNSNDLAIGQGGGDASAAVADEDGWNTVTASEYEQDCGGGAMADRPANAGARNAEVGLVGDIRIGREVGEATAEEGTVSPPPLPQPPNTTPRQGRGKSGGRRRWWVKTRTPTGRRRWDDSGELGCGNGEGRAASGGGFLSCLPSSASSSASTVSPDSTNGSHTRAVRVSPAPGTPVRSDAANGDARGLRSVSTGAIYAPPTVGATVGQQQAAPSGGRRTLSRWARWKNGRRVPASPMSTGDAVGGRR